MIRDLRRIILNYTNQMRRLERIRDYHYLRSYECVLSEFDFLNKYCKQVIAHFPHISVNKRILCLEGFFLPLFLHTPSKISLNVLSNPALRLEPAFLNFRNSSRFSTP